MLPSVATAAPSSPAAAPAGGRRRARIVHRGAAQPLCAAASAPAPVPDWPVPVNRSRWRSLLRAIAIALGAVAALTRRRAVWFASMAVGAAGIAFFAVAVAG
jgi:hypothetical protein